MITITPFIKSFHVSFTPSSELDVVGYRIHACPASELVLGDLIPSASNMINEGPETSFFYTLPEAQPAGTWYVKIVAIDSFGDDELNYSALQSVVVPSFQINPDELYSSLRVDFFVRNSVFKFNLPSEGAVTTLLWSSGYIDRGDQTYTLASGSITTAQDCYIIATLNSSGNTATLSKVSIGSGLPALASNQVIIVSTSASTLSTGNYIAYVRQANSILVEGAAIRDATIESAKIKNLSADLINAGNLILSGSGAGAIRSGQTAYNTGTGFWLGSDSGTPKFSIGNPAGNFITWDGTGLNISGNVVMTGGSVSWANVTSKPTIPTNTNQLTDGAGLGTTASWANVSGRPNTTYIGTDGIYTGTLIAENITGTTLTGKTIQTDATGERLIVSSSTHNLIMYDSSGNWQVQIGTGTSPNSVNAYGYFGDPYTNTRKGVFAGSTSDIAVQGTSGTSIGVRGTGYGGVYGYASSAVNNYYGLLGECMGAYGVNYGAPLRLVPSTSASAPAHTSEIGSIWVTSTGVMYINTSGSTTWTKVGAQ